MEASITKNVKVHKMYQGISNNTLLCEATFEKTT